MAFPPLSPAPALAPSEFFGPPGPAEDPLLAELAAVALQAAAGAAAIQVDGLGRAREQVDTKSSDTDQVSEIDRAAERAVAAVLARDRPDDALLGEEGTERGGASGVRWVVDPLDGTTNYLFGVPAFAVSIAAEVEGVAVVGVVVDPSRGETWAAVKGRGARVNGRVCHGAPARSTLATALVGTGFSYHSERRAWQAATLARVLPVVRDIRRFGAAALDLCWVAGGRLDAYYEWGLEPWDRAAGLLICQEAGVAVSTHPSGTVVAAMPDLEGPLLDLLDSAGAL